MLADGEGRWMGRVDAGFCAGRAESEDDGDMRGRGEDGDGLTFWFEARWLTLDPQCVMICKSLLPMT